MSKPIQPRPLPDEGEKAIEKVLRVNQRWIVHGRLKENAAAYLAHLRESDPERLLQASELALRMVHRKKLIRDPKPLFYAGIFAFATLPEIATYLEEHAMTRAISLLLHGDTSGREALSDSARDLATGIASEIQEEQRAVA
jgi:hypothetical protein